MTVNMASLLEQALATLVNTFQEYSQFSGNSLCQAKFKELLEKELPTWAPVSTWAEPPGEALLEFWEKTLLRVWGTAGWRFDCGKGCWEGNAHNRNLSFFICKVEENRLPDCGRAVGRTEGELCEERLTRSRRSVNELRKRVWEGN